MLTAIFTAAFACGTARAVMPEIKTPVTVRGTVTDVSHSLVRERFRTVYGKSLRDVILDMRVKAAMSLLSRTKASVREIALKVGFSSDAHFVRYFRKKTGTTPAAYRSSSKAR